MPPTQEESKLHTQTLSISHTHKHTHTVRGQGISRRADLQTLNVIKYEYKIYLILNLYFLQVAITW